MKRKLITLPPIAYLLRTSKRVTLPGFEGIPVYDVLHFFFQQVRKIGFSERAAAISFNIVMAIPGGLIFLFTLVPFLPASIGFKDQLLTALDDVLSNRQVYDLLAGVINDFFATERSGLMWLSVAFIIFFSSNAMMGIMNTFDKSYFEGRSTRFMAKRWTAFRLTFLLVLLIIASMLLLATQGNLKTLILKQLGWDNPLIVHFVNYSRWLIILALTYFTIAFIYRYGPAVKVKWSLRSPGAVLATLLTIFVTWLFSIWVNNFSQINKVYGSVGTVIILMNIVYINSLILIIGFEINVSIASIKAHSRRRILVENEEASFSQP
ncbi:MAG: YihY/virulence factor BrkB family protein [Chitinophagaceae bacterium]|nr:YihY/virulence factor BrkB family protein [Chitinophagaceae bacterium]